MKKIVIAFVFAFHSQYACAASVKSFLNGCAWGVVGGASAGIVSLAFTDKPSESWNNVARGASLGLYAGIAYGLYQLEETPEEPPMVLLFPNFENGKLSNLTVSGVVLKF